MEPVGKDSESFLLLEFHRHSTGISVPLAILLVQIVVAFIFKGIVLRFEWRVARRSGSLARQSLKVAFLVGQLKRSRQSLVDNQFIVKDGLSVRVDVNRSGVDLDRLPTGRKLIVLSIISVARISVTIIVHHFIIVLLPVSCQSVRRYLP